MSTATIPGYSLGDPQLARSPITLEELDLLQQSLLWSQDDERYLRLSREVLADQVEQVLDVWYGFVAANPFLVHYFSRRNDGQPDGDYLAAVRKRFGQWILDTAAADYDQAWLDYQHEIGRRHHRVAKNTTDRVDAVEHIPLRYLITFIYPITATLTPFLAAKGHSEDEVGKMQDAWRKAVTLQVALWAEPYTTPGDF